jgi:hypothetical protein
MKQNEDQFRLDRIAVRYLEATERGDLDLIAELWAAAAADPEIETLLHELNEELTVAPQSRHRRAWIGLAAVATAACIAALVWTFGEKRDANVPKTDANSHQAPVIAKAWPHASGATAAATASNVSHIALLTTDLEGAKLPDFVWPFSESPVVRGSIAIPADLLK